MNNQHTRRGGTQEGVNTVIKNKSHSRKFLSGIFHACRDKKATCPEGFLLRTFNACCCKIEENALLNGYVEDAEQLPLSIRPFHKKAFTLIELLVVVLIIGILAAVALPQYQKAAVRSQVMGIVALQKSIANAQRLYMLEHDTYPTSFDELNLALDSMKARTASTLGAGNVLDARYNDTFEINLYQTGNGIFLKQGPYKGCGMYINRETGKWSCMEWHYYYKGKPGGFCQEIMKSEPMIQDSSNVRAYPMEKLG